MKKFKEIMRCVGVKLINIIDYISSFLNRNINRLTLSKVLVKTKQLKHFHINITWKFKPIQIKKNQTKNK